MKSNNPFKIHSIEHLSISKLNLWVNDPAKFVATYLCNMASSVGVGAFRGTSVEYALNEKLKNNNISDNIVEEHLFGTFEKECIENNVDINSDNAIKEKKKLMAYYNSAIELYGEKSPELYQHKIYYSIHEDLPIKFLGYIDFVFDDSIRDLKTTGAMPSKMSQAHARQLALYSKAFPEKEVWCDYVTPKQAVSYKLTDPELKLKEIVKISLGLMKFLSISNDAYELASMFYPNFDSWMWNDDNKKQSTKIWRNE